MPTIAFKSRIRTVSDNCTLDLVVLHRLVAGEPSAAPRVVKNLPPKGLNIVLVSPLTITVTGMLNDKRISAEGLMSSCIAQHLLEYLKLNSNELGFEVISDTHIAEDTGCLTFFCTASRPSSPLEVQLPHLKLLGFDIDYSWHETPSLSSPETSGLLDSVLTPFSSRLTLPYVTALNNAVERFVKFQMVKRYPRIFGSWIQQLDMEKPYIFSMFTSLNNILRRSSNPAFQESCKTQLKILEKTMLTSLADSENRLSSYLESPGTFNIDKCQHALPDDETVFIHAMEHIYCLAMKRPKFKIISTSQNRLHAADDIFCDQQSLFVGFEEEPHSGLSDEDLNMCLGQYGGIADDRSNVVFPSLAEDLFADLLDTQLETDQLLQTPGASSDGIDSFHDSISLNVAQQCGAPTPDFVLSDPSSGAFIHPASSCAEGYRYHLLSESQVEPSSSDAPSAPLVSAHSLGDTYLEALLQMPEDLPTPFPQFAETVSWDYHFNTGVDFVAMEF